MKLYSVILIISITLFAQKEVYTSNQSNDIKESNFKKNERNTRSENTSRNTLLKLKYEFNQFHKLNSLQDSSQGEVSSKSPWLAFLLSMLLPTSGQLYNGDYTKAIIQAGLMLGGGGLVTTMACVECGDYGTAQTGLLIAGAAMLISGYFWSIIDAPMSANRINSELNLAEKQRDKNREINAFENSRIPHPNNNLISIKIQL